jgi:hypothetical protein
LYPWALAKTPTHLFVTSDKGVVRVAADGSVDTVADRLARGIAYDGTDLYWTELLEGAVVRASAAEPATSQKVVALTAGSWPWDLVASADHVFWVSRGGPSAVWRLDKPSGEVEAVVTFPEGTLPVSVAPIALRDGYLYWATAESAVERMPEAGGNVEVLWTGDPILAFAPTPEGAILVQATPESKQAVLWRVPTSGQPSQVATGWASDWGQAVVNVGPHYYWHTGTGDHFEVRRIPAGGGLATVLAGDVGESSGLFAELGALLWCEPVAGRVLRLPIASDPE